MATIDFVRVVSSLVASELANARKTSVLLEPLATISAETQFTGGGLEVDSLELMRLASAVNELFHLHETTAGDYLLQDRSIGAWARIVSAAWDLGHDQLTFRTSGSSGEPKRCTHAFAQLEREVAEHAVSFSSAKRVLAAVPSHHIYGFIFTVLLPARLKCEVVDVRTWSPAKLKRESRPGDVLVASPSFWEYVSRSVDRFETPLQGVTSTAPCSDALFARLNEQGIALIEIYGSSELGGIGRRSAPSSPFELLAFWERSGEFLLRKDVTPEARFELVDNLEWTGQRTFFVRGRRDGAVQIGGINVFPERVAAHIALHPAVKECVVRLMRPEEGDRLKAFIVWREPEGESSSPEDLRRWITAELPTCERPKALKFGPVLPRNDLGKLVDWEA